MLGNRILFTTLRNEARGVNIKQHPLYTMVCIHRRFLNPRGVFINSGEHSFSAQSLIKRQGARRNGPPSHPSLLKIRVGAATRSTSPKALDQFSHILTTMSVRGECWEIEYCFERWFLTFPFEVYDCAY